MSLVNNHVFTFYSVGHFCPTSAFSRIEFELQPYEHFIAMSKLFNLSTITDKLTRCLELQKSFKNMAMTLALTCHSHCQKQMKSLLLRRLSTMYLVN